MGKERDELIRRLGGTPLSDLDLTDAEILQLARDTYWDRGEIPPEITECFNEKELEAILKKINRPKARRKE